MFSFIHLIMWNSLGKDCEIAFKIGKLLEFTHNRTTQVKNSRLIRLAIEYKVFKIDSNESTIHIRFITFVSELDNLGKNIINEKMVGKISRSLSKAWESKVRTIKEAKNILDFDEFIGSLITYKGKTKDLKVEDNGTNNIFLVLKSVTNYKEINRYNCEE